MLEEGAYLSIYDPKVSIERINEDFDNYSFDNQGKWKKVSSIPDALKNADAVLIITDWAEFFGLDWNYLSTLMRSPAWIFDTRSVVNRNEIEKTDLNLWKLGEGR